MLKRALIIAALFVVGVVLLGSTPATDPPDEVSFEITEGEASYVAGISEDGASIAIIWGEGVEGDLSPATPSQVSDRSKANYANIPDEILDQLPEHIRDAMDAQFGSSGGVLNSSDWYCFLNVPRPYEDEDNNLVTNTQNLDCGGSDLHKIRLRSLVERQSGSVWFTLTSHDSGWLTNTGVEINLGAACPAGTFDYRAKGFGRAMLTDWTVYSFNLTSNTREIAC